MMSSHVLCCLLVTEFFFGSLLVIESQPTSMTPGTTASSSSVFDSNSSFSAKHSDSLAPSTTAIHHSTVINTSDSSTSLLNNPDMHNFSTTAASPNSSSSSPAARHTSEPTRPPVSSTSSTNFIIPAQSSQNDTSVTTTSAASPTATTFSVTHSAVNTSVTASFNGSQNTPSSSPNTSSSTVTETNSSTTHSATATGNSITATTPASTSNQTVHGNATTHGFHTTDESANTSNSASANTTTAGSSTESTSAADQNATTLAPVTSTVPSNDTSFTARPVTVETVGSSSSSSSSSPVTIHSSAETVITSSTAVYSSMSIGQTTSNPASVPPWIAAPIILGVLFIVAVVVVVLLFLRRRKKKQRTSKFVSLERRQKEQLASGGIMNPSFRIDTDDNERSPPAPVCVEDFVNHVSGLHRDSDYGFASEFSALNKMSPQNSKAAAELPENRTKNRFTNVLPFDHSRVKLIPADDDENSGSDYINASFLPGFSSRREFIAAQGPMKSTVDDFWRMIWEYNVTTVVMVTNLFERGREKCVQYWPEQNEPMYYGDIQVDLKSESLLNYYTIRVLNITLEQKSRRVMHYQFMTWPDFGVPKEHSHLLSFLTQVRSSLHPTSSHPVLVHCSAGVGRTGTFILIDHVLQLIRRNSAVDLFGLVLDMRNYRPHMIQTEAQYIFAHECIKEAIELGYHQGRDIVASSDDTATGEAQPESEYMNAEERKK